MARFRLRRRRPAPRRRRVVRKGRSKRSTINVNRALQPIPQRYICKMKYATTVSTDVDGQYVFNLNSLYDPDRTGLGHQPYAMDTLSVMYNRYRVIACGWRIQHLLNPSATTSRMVAAIPSNDVSVIWSMDELRENPRAKYITTQVGGSPPTLHGKIYIPSLVGRNKAQYMADDNYQALVTTSPSENALLYVKVTDNATNPLSAAAIQVLLEYTVEFFDVKRQLPS